ncbi:HTH-type transcriptional regulator CysL [Marinovum algicola]|uniref:LysR family transcriptional regulator, nitrogen assimilation regulatory protein n=1 Tax=Marinovum algicola TaxID=42444 RepID=A0A975WEZ2_9RHOB|nr:LysR family transcriptional regulator [Marinovum algicola]SEK09105.1 LysR family transcriptional regulator, nitrogen assimilation regulatory protein [Marinovum algicola]SLN71647.1 HTH-type transcriptional regulator CysL [Marinovum algicola]
MDVRQLRYFLEIVDQGSLSAASRSLNVAQPALSLHMRNMEERLQTDLLLRSARGSAPTEAGALLASRARAILADLARTEDEIRNLDKSPGGAVRLGLSVTISEILTLPLIEALQEKYPRITLNIADAMSGFVSGWLEEGRIDLALLYASASGHDIEQEALVEEELVLVQGAENSGQGFESLRDLQNLPMILPSKGHGLRDLLDSLATHAETPLRVTMEIDSYRNIKLLVAAGHGASILPLHAVREEIAEGRLLFQRMQTPVLRRKAVIRRTGTITRAQQAVEETIHDVVAELVQEGHWVGATLV